MKLLNKMTYMAGVALAGLALTTAPVLAEEEAPAPSTEHQSDVMKEKKGGAEAEGKTKKGATGSKESMEDKSPPATKHQEEALKGEQKADDSSKKMMEEPAAPQ